MKPVFLERHDPVLNMHRFYHLWIMEGILEWSLVKEWGRLGSPGTVRCEWFESADAAEQACQQLLRQKWRKGYRYRGLDNVEQAGPLAESGYPLPSTRISDEIGSLL